MLVGVESSTSRSVGASETGEKKEKTETMKLKGSTWWLYGVEMEEGSNTKSGFLTRLLCPAERLAVLCAAHCEDVHQVLGVCGETCQGEVVPWWGQPLVLGPSAAGHLVADAITGDFALGSEPVDGEGVGKDLRETQADWWIQSCGRLGGKEKAAWRSRSAKYWDVNRLFPDRDAHLLFSALIYSCCYIRSGKTHLFSWCQQGGSSPSAHKHTPRSPGTLC